VTIRVNPRVFYKSTSLTVLLLLPLVRLTASLSKAATLVFKASSSSPEVWQPFSLSKALTLELTTNISIIFLGGNLQKISDLVFMTFVDIIAKIRRHQQELVKLVNPLTR